MARRVKAPTLENRTARLKLPVRKKPYSFTTIAPGIAIGYRRNQGPGRWVLRAGNGRGGYWTDVIALADDHEPADGSAVLTFWQAQDKARILVRGKDAAGDRPATVAEALDIYERDLAARNGATVNARVVRNLLPAALLAKPVALLTVKELRRWRDSLLDTRQPSSVTRICKSFKACLNLAAAHDQRIGNSAAWRTGLSGLPDSNTARHVALPEADVRAIVAAAYTVDPAFGLWSEVAATTGARPQPACPPRRRRSARRSRRRPLDAAILAQGQGPQAHRTAPGTDPEKFGHQAAASGGRSIARLRHYYCARMAAAGSTKITAGCLPGRRRRPGSRTLRLTRCGTAASSVRCWPVCQRG